MAMLPPRFKAACVSRVRLAWTATYGEECTLPQENRGRAGAHPEGIVTLSLLMFDVGVETPIGHGLSPETA
jgi:hypothetical protein